VQEVKPTVQQEVQTVEAVPEQQREAAEHMPEQEVAATERAVRHESAAAQPQARQEPPAQQPQEPGNEPQTLSAAKRAAAKRAAEERVERLEQALKRMPEMEAKKEPEDKKKARVSTTDPEATVMKMANGGYNPAYNFEYSTDCPSQVIVGVKVLTAGTDQGQLPPMLDQIEDRFGTRPKEALVDGGVVSHATIDAVQEVEEGKQECKVYAPVPKPKKEEVDRHAPHVKDSEQVAEWRQRMATAEAKEIYKERASTAECVNAQARNRGLIRLLVRGVKKVTAIAFWFAIAHNVARGLALAPEPALAP
jgi:hypothetical protein